ncbi:MAG TPA: DUF6542 domain-containing protein [Streptosporangiaceae bacterium]
MSRPGARQTAAAPGPRTSAGPGGPAHRGGPARPGGPRPRPGAPLAGAHPAGAHAAGAHPAGAADGRPGLRLTGRGAILCLFLLSFVGIALSGWLSTELVADVLFLTGCGAMAWYTKPSDLLPVTVSPPLAFFFACLLAKLISSSGGTSAAEGVLVTLATSAPWLFAGTALTIVIALRRGLLENIRELRRGLRGTPGETARADERARRR